LLLENLLRVPAERLREVGGSDGALGGLKEVEEALEGIGAVVAIRLFRGGYLVDGL
jgi:hypothetical protein